jgi:hypothetical protein
VNVAVALWKQPAETFTRDRQKIRSPQVRTLFRGLLPTAPTALRGRAGANAGKLDEVRT